jgi:hypothetical protein
MLSRFKADRDPKNMPMLPLPASTKNFSATAAQQLRFWKMLLSDAAAGWLDTWAARIQPKTQRNRDFSRNRTCIPRLLQKVVQT